MIKVLSGFVDIFITFSHSIQYYCWVIFVTVDSFLL